MATDVVSWQILEWGDMAKLPWGIVLLLGGGFALADAFKVMLSLC